MAFIPRAFTPTKEVLNVRLAVSNQTWANIGATEPLLFVPLDRALRDAQPVAEFMAGVVMSGFVVHGLEQKIQNGMFGSKKYKMVKII